MEEYPVVEGSTWIVDNNGIGVSKYGLDTVGYEYGVVNLIQTQGPQNGVKFPCNIYIYQHMTYDSSDFYSANLLTQTVTSTTVQVCRSSGLNECSPIIKF
jgi:hypothetical protein